MYSNVLYKQIVFMQSSEYVYTCITYCMYALYLFLCVSIIVTVGVLLRKGVHTHSLLRSTTQVRYTYYAKTIHLLMHRRLCTSCACVYITEYAKVKNTFPTHDIYHNKGYAAIKNKQFTCILCKACSIKYHVTITRSCDSLFDLPGYYPADNMYNTACVFNNRYVMLSYGHDRLV